MHCPSASVQPEVAAAVSSALRAAEAEPKKQVASAVMGVSGGKHAAASAAASWASMPLFGPARTLLIKERTFVGTAAMAGFEEDTTVEVEPQAELESIYACGDDKRCVRKSGNLQCSGNDDFCFLCSFQDTPDHSGMLLKDHISSLVYQGKELKFIATAVQKIYNEELRDFAVHEKICNDEIVEIERPEWKISAIIRHLLMSTETEAVFETYQNQIYKSLIVRQAERIVDKGTGMVDSRATKELLTTMKAFDEHKGKMTVHGAKRRRTEPKVDNG